MSFDFMHQPGPCVICGDTNYSLSCGGPTICPKCDCGNFDSATVMKQAKVIAELRAQLASAAQEAPAPVAWRVTDGEGDYKYLTVEPSDQSRAWSRRYGREWEPLYASPVSSTQLCCPAGCMFTPCRSSPFSSTSRATP